MQILLFHPDPDATAMISFCIESQSKMTVHRATSFQAAMDFLLGEIVCDLLITSEFSETDKLFKYIMSTGSTIPVILVSDDPKATLTTYPDIRVLGQMKLTDIQTQLFPLVNAHFKETIALGDKSEFCRIHSTLLLRVTPLKGDIYIRLSNIKFVKLFRQGAKFTNDDLERYFHRRKITHLYVKKEESKEFVEKFERDLQKFVLEAKPEDPQLLETLVEVQDLVHQLSTHMGLSAEVMSIAQSNVKLAMKAIGASPSLTKAIHASSMGGKNYISAHSVALANICCAISAKMEWPSETTYQKLIMASFFHDLVLTNVEHAKILTSADLNLARYKVSEDDFNTIKNHPFEGSLLLKGLVEVPEEVSTIVTQHHERPDGSGFPMGLRSHQISPLAAVLIVAHDLLDASTQQKESFKLRDFLIDMDPVYQGIVFRKVWRALATADPELSVQEDAA